MKGILVVLLDTRGVTTPDDLEGKPLTVETYAWTDLPPETDHKALAIEALSQKAGELVMKFVPETAPDTKVNYRILPPEQLHDFIYMAVQAYNDIIGEPAQEVPLYCSMRNMSNKCNSTPIPN